MVFAPEQITARLADFAVNTFKIQRVIVRLSKRL